uniref:Uncharacterized protein n=1 Tax=Rangifer tarandus platyrhynchus TaxID=3082113 RepID=A0ACB0FC39_RANTA|nr:unnamed protein product [Rangifer tarandus platyrhynchus]
MVLGSLQALVSPVVERRHQMRGLQALCSQGTFPVVLWFKIHIVMQGVRVRRLVREIRSQSPWRSELVQHDRGACVSLAAVPALQRETAAAKRTHTNRR